jgi:hypothetical protein
MEQQGWNICTRVNHEAENSRLEVNTLYAAKEHTAAYGSVMQEIC